MGVPKSENKIWVLINIVLICLYLYFASWIWAPLGVKTFQAGLAGDPIVWGGTAGITLIVCSLVNLAWLARLLWGLHKGRKKWRPILIWVLVILSWFGATRYDYYNQRNGVTFPIGHKKWPKNYYTGPIQ